MQLDVLLVSDQVRGIDGTGGLGDVATGLARELARRSDVTLRLVMPGYQTALQQAGPADPVGQVTVPLGERNISLSVMRGRLPKFSPDEPPVELFLLAEPHLLAHRENSPLQAILLARGCLALVDQLGACRPDLIHCNDWHTGAIPLLLRTVFADDPILGRVATLYTVHNNAGEAFQGAFPLAQVQHLARLPESCYRPGVTRSVEFWGKFNFAKGGIGFADLINTVSPTYARELRTHAFGGGLESVMAERASDLCGVLNGIDLAEWNPAVDPHLPETCRFGDNAPVEEIRRAKRQVRLALREWTSPQGTRPFARLADDSLVAGIVTRISDQKFPLLTPLPHDTGLDDEIPGPLERLAREHAPIQFVILGSADRSDEWGQLYCQRLQELAREFPWHVQFHEGFDVALSHLITAAADLFLVPSTFEPCGLTQMSAMRYGAVPVVRAVGGLRDTVIDAAQPRGNGFTFLELDGPPESWLVRADVARGSELLYAALRRAMAHAQQPAAWDRLIEEGRRRDSGWRSPAAQYRRLYELAVLQRTEAAFGGPRQASDLLARFSQIEDRLWRVLTLAPLPAAHLEKFAAGRFGRYELTESFRTELELLQRQGYLTPRRLDAIPERGENLSDHLDVTNAGREFVQKRQALRAALD